MSCCGSQRANARFGGQPLAPTASVSGRSETPRPWNPGGVDFEYVGRGQIRATGPITGVRYRFDAGGARVRVDGRDAPSFLAIPGLRIVR